MYECFTCMSTYVSHVFLKGLEESARVLEAGVKDVCEPLCGSYESNLGPSKKHLVPLTNEPFLHFQTHVYILS